MTDAATVKPMGAGPRVRSAPAAWTLWLARRLGLAVLTLWLTSVLVFLATTALGDPVKAILGKSAETSPARAEQIRAQLNLDDSIFERYAHWLGGLLTGDLGTSVANQQPVSELLGDRVINSGVLVLIAAVVMIPIAFGVALICANARGRRTDQAIQLVLLTLAGLPEFVIGILLVAVFSTTLLHILPAVTISAGGESPWQNPASMILPVATLVLAVAPYIIRIVRSTLLEVLDSDYVELARLKGVPERVVLRKHALLNAIVPGIQVIALQLAWLAGGVVIVEYLFSYPGVGASLVDSVRNSDIPMVQALAMIIAAVYVVVNLVADVLSILFTPRARTAIGS
ncbi:ABC transporter permease [Solicola gregarius]|uniref:ABC transporter permease n=1 Tax=Solicola gregarius TaxID=2908642 RepID=A0AA46TLM0_9ACTN|nr:ABC transporter permease [Solicola gregarius]UYM07510.1 ABC transporter permease [Solicola gregarius]